MYSPCLVTGIQYMTKSNRRNKKNNNSNRNNNQRTRVVIREVPRPMSVGASIGDSLQKMALSTFKRITGMGDYKLSPNIKDLSSNSMMQKFAPAAPKFGNTASSFVFEHAEFLGDINGSTNLQVANYNINPLDPVTFPWLSQVASSFESYQIEGMLVRFESTSGQATGTNTAVGTVMSYIAYDINDPAPTSKQTILQYDGVVDAKASENFLLGVECDPDRLVMKRLYVGFPPSEAEARFYNFAKIVVANQGQQGTNQIGEMWLHYRIRFYVAKDAGVSTGIDPPIATFSSLATPTPASAPFFGTVVGTNPTIPLKFSNNQLSFQGSPGAIYSVYLNWLGTPADLEAPGFSYSGCANFGYPSLGTYFKYGFDDAGPNSGNGSISMLVKCSTTAQPGTPSVISLSGGVFPGTCSFNGWLVKVQ